MRSYWVYIVECSDASYYTGITNDVDRRVAEHNLGTDAHAYTFMRRPVVLVYSTEYADPDSAIRFEKQVKGWTRAKKRALIRGDWAALRARPQRAR